MTRKPTGLSDGGRRPMIGKAGSPSRKPAKARTVYVGNRVTGVSKAVPKSGQIAGTDFHYRITRSGFRIFKAKKESGAVNVPHDEIDALKARIEELEDARDLAAAAKNAKAEDYLPAALMNRIIDGAHPVRVWREHRGLSARALAEKADIPASYLSEIENRKKPGSIEAYRALAEALDLTIDDLAP
jgi:hypothetical protein